MNPQVVAATIAASVSVLTLIGTLAAQYFGRRATSRDTEKTLEEQGKHLDRTLAEQFTSTEVVYGVTGTEVTELPEYGVSP